MSDPHVLALLATSVLVGAAVAGVRVKSVLSARAALGSASGALAVRGEPYILYFSGPNCSVCRTHQEPALGRLEGVSVDKVDAVERQDLAERFHVYTVPSTVVVAADGTPAAVNYGYAPADRLRRQLAEAGHRRLAAVAS